MKLLLIPVAAVAGFLAIFHPPTKVKLVEAVSKSLVFVSGDHESEDGGKYSCTGWMIVDERVMTNAHCVGEHMKANGLPVRVQKAEPFFDLALLDVADLHLPALPVRLTTLQPLEQTFSAGFAYGWRRPMFLQTAPVIMHFSPSDALPAPGTMSQFPTIPGMSGGPIVDRRGRVVGMNCASDHFATNYGIEILQLRAFLSGTDIDLE